MPLPNPNDKNHKSQKRTRTTPIKLRQPFTAYCKAFLLKKFKSSSTTKATSCEGLLDKTSQQQRCLKIYIFFSKLIKQNRTPYTIFLNHIL